MDQAQYPDQRSGFLEPLTNSEDLGQEFPELTIRDVCLILLQPTQSWVSAVILI